MNSRTIGAVAFGLFASTAVALRLSNPTGSESLAPESAAAVGSLPPLGADEAGAKNSLPLFMLPSSVNVVTHAAGSTEDDPRARPQCRKIEKVVENGPRRNRDTSDFAAFQTIISVLMGNGTEPTEEWVRNSETGELEKVEDKSDEEKKPEGEEKLSEFFDEDFFDPEQDDANDKLIANAMFTIERGHSVSGSLDWNLIASLRNCAVDKYGRTMFMKMVRKGYVTSLATAASRSLAGAKLYNLRDTLQNNIIHLGVMSKNKVVLQQVKGLLGADRARVLMDMKNMSGKTPLDLAIESRLIDVQDFLKTTFSSVSAAQLSGHRTFSSNLE